MTKTDSPMLAAHTEAKRFGYNLSATEAAHIAEAVLAASGLRDPKAGRFPRERDIAAIEARAEQYAKRYPWRLEGGAKDYLPRDRETLLIAVRRLQALLGSGESKCPTCGSDDPRYRFGTPCSDAWHGVYLNKNSGL